MIQGESRSLLIILPRKSEKSLRKIYDANNNSELRMLLNVVPECSMFNVFNPQFLNTHILKLK